MTISNSRARLLGGAAIGLGLTMAAAQPAQAACTITTTTNPSDTIDCIGTTTTTDTLYPANIPSDRAYEFTTDVNLVVNVAPTATVDGFGLALVDLGGSSNFLNINNNGAIQVDAGNTPTAGGGDAALFVSSVDTPIVYNGGGSIANLGTGDGFGVAITGSGSLNATIGGGVRAENGDAIQVVSTAPTGGAISIATTAGNVIGASGGDGIDVTTAGTGDVNILSTAAIGSAGLANTLQNGIIATSTGTGNVTVASDAGTVGTLADRAQLAGITATITNAVSDGNVGVTVGTGGVASVGDAVVASTTGTGDVSVLTNGVLDSLDGTGIETDATSGTTSIITNAAINAGAFGIDASSTGGALTLDANAAVTSAGNAIVLANTDGAINADISGAATSNSGIGLLTTSTNGNQLLTVSGPVSSVDTGINSTVTGTGTLGITASGPINSSAGDGIAAASTTGALTVDAGVITAGAVGIYASTTDGTLSVNQSGALTSSDIGIDVQSSGTGAVTVNRTGTGVLTSTGSTGIQADSTTGAINITTGAISAVAGDGVDAETTTGPITVNVTGNVSGGASDGVHAVSTSGNVLVNVTAGTVTGADDAVEVRSAGTQTVNVSSGAILTGDYGVYGSGTGAFVVNNNGTITGTSDAIISELATPTTINNNATGTLNGTVDLSDLADTVNNAGIWNASGNSNFYAGADLVNNMAGGTINLDTGATFDGLETFTNAGTVNATGTIAFTGVATDFTNTGTFDTDGATTISGLVAFDNDGTLDLAPGVFTTSGAFTNTGIILADEGATTITGQTSFANTGTIDLSDGVTDDVLTIDSDFAGSGGSTLMLDVDDDAADQLVIAGAASGSTMVDANLIGTGILIADGVLLVDAGTSTEGAFSLGGVSGNTSPLLNYALEQRDADYFLTTEVNATGFVPVPVTQVAGEMWYQSAEAVRAQTKLPDDGTDGMKLWAQVYGSRDKAGGIDRQTIGGDDYDVDNRLDTDRLGFQVGAGFGMGTGSIGVTGGLERADAHGDAADYEARGWNIGAYGMFGGPTGVHGALLVKHDRFDIDMGNGLFEGIDPDGRSTGVDGEVGYRFGGTSGPAFGVSAGLAHVRTKIDDFSLAGLEYDYDSMTSTRGRVGVRATGNGPLSPFVDVRGYHEFSGDGDVRLSDGIDSYRLNAEGRGTWARVEAGIGGPASGLAPMVSAWVDFGDVKGFGGRGSFRF